jgi:hypothetical protein
LNHVLLTGAGFTRNWGGFLAADVTTKLLGSPFMNAHLRTLLERYRRDGGFEGALEELQSAGLDVADENLVLMEKAIRGLFEEMNESLRDTTFEFSNEMAMQVATFLSNFDAIFTLNQDVLLELHYLSASPELRNSQKWAGVAIPGMRARPENYVWTTVAWREPDPGGVVVGKRTQPYIKLHGSANWYGADGQRLMIAGGGKREAIRRFPVLARYMEIFEGYLNQPETRLMVIGYGFGDGHINEIVERAATKSDLELYIIDRNGLDAMSPGRRGAVSELQAALTPRVIGESKRPLDQVFGGKDVVEHRSVMKFFRPA